MGILGRPRDPDSVIAAVRDIANYHTKTHKTSLHVSVTEALGRYYATGDPAALDGTIFRDDRDYHFKESR